MRDSFLIRGGGINSMEDVDLRRYAALYGGLSLAVFLASVVLVLSFPTRANQITDVLGMPAQVGIVVGVHYYFVTTHKRLLASREYWTLVLYCTGISLIIGVVAGYIQIVSGVLSDLSPVGWLVAISAGRHWAISAVRNLLLEVHREKRLACGTEEDCEVTSIGARIVIGHRFEKATRRLAQGSVFAAIMPNGRWTTHPGRPASTAAPPPWRSLSRSPV